MSYFYDPVVNASYEKTRKQISLSIQNLQQKLRRRKSYEIELLRQEQMRNRVNWNNNYSPMKLYQNYNQQHLSHQPIGRLSNLEKQRHLLNYQNESYHRLYSKDHDLLDKNPAFKELYRDHDDSLVKKYEDGTKIKQYNQQLQNIHKNISTDRLYNSGVGFFKKMPNKSTQNIHTHNYNHALDKNFNTADKNKSSKYYQFEPKQEQHINYQTPYQKLYNFYGQSKQNNKHLQQIVYQSPSKKQEIPGVQTDRKIQRKLFGNYYHKNELSPQLKSQMRSNASIKKHSISNSKLSRNISKSYLQKSNIKNKQPQTSLKRIQNRLKLSQLVYEDSKFKNIKHQINHLFMTFDNECKGRNQIRQKINNYPNIIKRHGLVI